MEREKLRKLLKIGMVTLGSTALILLLYKLKVLNEKNYTLMGENKNLQDTVKGLTKTLMEQSYHLGKINKIH